MQHHYDHCRSSAEARSPVVEVDLCNAFDGTEYAGLEQGVRQRPGVTGAHLWGSPAK